MLFLPINMTPWGLAIISLSYILGLLSTGLPLGQQPIGGYGLLTMGLLCSWWLPHHWRLGPTRLQWIVAGLVALMGSIYCLARIPQPDTSDVSRYAPGTYSVYGEIVSSPQISRSGKGRFWFTVSDVQNRAQDAEFISRRSASGRLYVTAPLTLTKELRPGQRLKVTGRLYEPSSTGEFDFRAYLAKQGCFAGLSAKYIDQVRMGGKSQPGLWQVRQRIISAQGRWLGVDRGSLVSAMVLGRRAVDLPYETRDAFVEAGLAHTLAASGFHVALVLGLVLTLLKPQPRQIQALGGSLALVIYVGLTGLQPSVMRAAIMGLGAMAGLALERRVKPLGCLGTAVVLLLLWNPRWIWDIGFQLSVMATLGLMVMATALARRLDWLPSAIATLLSVPIAAYLWTLPLQLYHFGVVPSYSVVLNVAATPLVTAVSLGGFISAMVSVVWPLAGGAIAWPLALPLELLIQLVELFNQLPGNQIAVGSLPAWATVAAYVGYGAIAIFLARRHQTAAARIGHLGVE